MEFSKKSTFVDFSLFWCKNSIFKEFSSLWEVNRQFYFCGKQTNSKKNSENRQRRSRRCFFICLPMHYFEKPVRFFHLILGVLFAKKNLPVTTTDPIPLSPLKKNHQNHVKSESHTKRYLIIVLLPPPKNK